MDINFDKIRELLIGQFNDMTKTKLDSEQFRILDEMRRTIVMLSAMYDDSVKDDCNVLWKEIGIPNKSDDNVIGISNVDLAIEINTFIHNNSLNTFSLPHDIGYRVVELMDKLNKGK